MGYKLYKGGLFAALLVVGFGGPRAVRLGVLAVVCCHALLGALRAAAMRRPLLSLSLASYLGAALSFGYILLEGAQHFDRWGTFMLVFLLAATLLWARSIRHVGPLTARPFSDRSLWELLAFQWLDRRAS